MNDKKTVYILDTSQILDTGAGFEAKILGKAPGEKWDIKPFDTAGWYETFPKAMAEKRPDVLIINAGRDYENLDLLEQTRRTGTGVVLVSAHNSEKVEAVVNGRGFNNVVVFHRAGIFDSEKLDAAATLALEKGMVDKTVGGQREGGRKP